MLCDGRLSTLRSKLRDAQVDAFLVTHPVNVAYITGFEGVFDSEDAHAAVVSSDAAVLYTDSRYFDSALRASEGTPWQVVLAKRDLFVTVCEDLAQEGRSVLALETSVPYGRFKFISEQWGGNVAALDQLVERIRKVKEADELRRILAAQQLTDRTFDHILDWLRPGVTELEIALELEFFMRREGSEGVAFPPIVASGPNSAFPHARVTVRELTQGDFVKLDFGAVVEGYCADMTRTVVLGAASERQREIYRAVLDANLAGIAAIAPGVPGRSVDRVARSVIEDRGFGDRFGHGLGHGVGMQVHELPSMGPRGSESLLVGNVVTVEPGVYIPGFGGVRIEDLVVVEEHGARVLTGSAKELLEL
ncbi:MAG: Xaa-Pro dipeptidase [Actinobacteria bacterium HGW-Actinobacteria-7]|nr:MAG: Xaa-Pro dipeptidase [Actinobacteria bacterium HGW-Actinobacteria-7]